MKKLQFESTVHKQRFILGIICGLLPVLCTLFGFASCTWGGNSWEVINSISETYYSNHNSIMLIALGLCSFFLFTYEGYDLGDRVLTCVAGAGSLGVAFFPCESVVANSNIGLFSLSLPISNVIHFISAGMVFGGFALMTLTQFTKGNDVTRNKLYRICGIIMIVALAVVPIRAILNWPDWLMMLLEFFMLEAFSVSWIVKSKVTM